MKKNVSNKGVKRPGSAIAVAPGSEAKKRALKKVEMPEDSWLDVLKHLSCPKWSKMRLVSHQLNGVVQRNVSRLPLVVIDSVAMETRVTYSLMPMLRKQRENEIKMIVSDSAILSDKQDQWFKDRGTTLDLSGDIQQNNAIIGEDLKENCCVDLCILGPAQKKKLTHFEKKLPCFSGQQFKADVLFYAKFSPHQNKYSWASMAFFLKLLYDPSTYVKNLSMYALDTKLKGMLFYGEEERYIRCGSFTLQMTADASVKDVCESVSWLGKNVQAEMVQFPKGVQYDQIEICDTVSNYLLSSSWTSASQVVKFGEINDFERFLAILIKKFPSVAVQSIFPTVVFSRRLPLSFDSLNNQLPGKRIVKEKLEDPEDDNDSQNSKGDKSKYSEGSCYETYTISNGTGRIRIKFIRLVTRGQCPRATRWIT